MKFNCDARKEREQKWHEWFAWYPVRVGHNDCRWLEVVDRRRNWTRTFMGWMAGNWHYAGKDRASEEA